MKKITSLLTLACLLMLCSSAFAQGVSHGSTMIPGIYNYYHSANSYNTSYLFLSNITDEPVQCTFKFYGHDGTDIGSRADIYTGSNTAGVSVEVATQTNTFTIPANGTYQVSLYTTNQQNIFGYAVVEWSSTNPKIAQALIGSHHIYGRSGAGALFRATDVINNGKPF